MNAISADGRMVAFVSEATNLDPRDTDPVLDVYVHDRVTKTTTLVSERLGAGPSVVGCYGVSISADGRFVAFDCGDDNVVPGDGNGLADVFVRDLLTQTTERVSLGPSGQPGDREAFSPSISGDGRFVAFVGAATNWFPVSPPYGSGIFVRDRLQGTTLAATMLPSGHLAPSVSKYPSISADGRYVAFESSAERLAAGGPFCCQDILRWDRLTGQIDNASLSFWGFQSTAASHRPQLSADGRYVAFRTDDHVLTVQPGPAPTVVWRDMETGTTVNVNEDPQGGPSNYWAYQAALSGDGRVVAFVSSATNLVPGASGNVEHVYVRACDVASPSSYCKPSPAISGCTARITSQGRPSATAGSGFDVRVQSLEPQRPALVFYGTDGPWGKPLLGGRLCLRPPVVRAGVGTSGGTAGCDGNLSMDFNAWIATGGDPSLVAGQSVYAQGWFRNSAGTGQLSDALAFLIGP